MIFAMSCACEDVHYDFIISAEVVYLEESHIK